jgi:hypothetical protein
MTMLAAHFGAVLAVTGFITAVPVFLFVAPAAGLRALFKLELADRGGLFFARHWGLIAAAMGALLVYAAGHPEVRAPVVLAAMVEKAGLAGLIASQWSEPHTRGMRLTAFFDGACSLVYAGWLLGA